MYGRNSTGGVINLITKRPKSEFGADGFVEVGNYGRVQLQTGVDTPITDMLAVRTAVSWIRHNGYDNNGGDDQDTKSGRVTAVWKPDTRTNVVGVVTYLQDGGIGPFNFNVPAVYGPYRQLNFDPKALSLFMARPVSGGWTGAWRPRPMFSGIRCCMAASQQALRRAGSIPCLPSSGKWRRQPSNRSI